MDEDVTFARSTFSKAGTVLSHWIRYFYPGGTLGLCRKMPRPAKDVDEAF